MRSADGRYVFVFNGEIFNAPALRAELEAEGVAFASDHSDTEVLLHLLARDGAAALPRLNGMFAFALHDRTAGTLLLARDRMGIKPLYWTQQNGRFAFASEMKSLLALPCVSRAIDRQSLFHYLSLMYVPGEQSIMAGIRRLPPGHTIHVDLADGTTDIRRWWTLQYQPDLKTPDDAWPERIRDTLADAVERWCLADVPIAASLSGGLDSSGIVGLAREKGRDIRTVSVGFTGAGEDSWNELPLARQVAEKWQTTHREVTLTPDDLLRALPRMVWHLDEPYGGGLPSWAVFSEMATEVKVGLTGVGGDEMFGNYGKWRALEGGAIRRLLNRQPDFERFRRTYFERWHYFADADKRGATIDSGNLEDSAWFLWRRYQAPGTTAVRDRTARIEIETQLPDEFLLMTDRFSMAHSLEARTPFLDNEFVDLALSIPAATRTRPHDLKGLLRRALQPVLPAEIVSAPKRGFVLPLAVWLRGPLRPLTERLLAPEKLAAQGIFHPDLLARHVQPHLDGARDLTTRVWGLLMFQLWYRLVFEAQQGDGLPASVEDLLDAA